MTNMIKLKTNFKNRVAEILNDLQPYFDLVKDYEQHAEWDLPRRTMIIYPGGSTQKSWYSNRKASLKKLRVDCYDDYDAMCMFLHDHNARTSTLSAKHINYVSKYISDIKQQISIERNIDMTNAEAIVGSRYPGFHLQPHVDGDDEKFRYHLILSTNKDNIFRDCENVTHTLEPGDIWELDVTKQHEVANLGNSPVSYMIIDAK